MALSANIPEIVEYRGVWGLVCAEVLTDDDTDGYTTGDVFAIAASSEIAKAAEGSSEAHYYNNVPAVVIDSEGPDTITIQSAAIPLEVQAELSGQYFDSATGAWMETPSERKYFALGYKTEDSAGNWVYVWRYKGKFSPLAQTNQTKDNGTTANGQELVYTGIHTTHKFTKTNATCKAINVPDSGNADLSAFFDEVTTPDTIQGATAYELTISQAANTTVTVTRNGQALATGATIYKNDQLKISVTGGTVTVNSDEWFSGDIHVVAGNVTVASTASA